MNKNFLSSILVALAFGLWVCPSWADTTTDYSCLNTCVKNGKSSSICLSQCAQDQPAGTAKSAIKTATDYRCVGLCTGGGKAAGDCLSLCTYIPTTNQPAPPSPGGTAVSTHELLQAPVPDSGAILVPHNKTDMSDTIKNYPCIQQCLHDGMQSDLCNQKCVAVTPEFQTRSQ